MPFTSSKYQNSILPLPITLNAHIGKTSYFFNVLSLLSDFTKLDPNYSCTTYDLVAVVTHHGSVGGS